MSRRTYGEPRVQGEALARRLQAHGWVPTVYSDRVTRQANDLVAAAIRTHHWYETGSGLECFQCTCRQYQQTATWPCGETARTVMVSWENPNRVGRYLARTEHYYVRLGGDKTPTLELVGLAGGKT